MICNRPCRVLSFIFFRFADDLREAMEIRTVLVKGVKVCIESFSLSLSRLHLPYPFEFASKFEPSSSLEPIFPPPSSSFAGKAVTDGSIHQVGRILAAGRVILREGWRGMKGCLTFFETRRARRIRFWVVVSFFFALLFGLASLFLSLCWFLLLCWSLVSLVALSVSSIERTTSVIHSNLSIYLREQRTITRNSVSNRSELQRSTTAAVREKQRNNSPIQNSPNNRSSTSSTFTLIPDTFPISFAASRRDSAAKMMLEGG